MQIHRLGAALVAAGAFTAGTGAVARAEPAGPPQGPARCSNVTVPASLGPGLPRDQKVFGRLCLPSGKPSSVLQVLVHGASYDHRYWDFPGFGGRYSYVRHMTAAGYGTLAIDQIGVGRSSHPPAVLITQAAAAYGVHEVVGAARRGALGPAFDRVVLAGHSFGSLTSWLEAGTYRDVDGVLASGASHAIGPGGLATVFSHARPAQLDPVVARSVPPADPGYVSIPGARRAAFYYLPGADPAVVAQDEATRSEIPIGVGATIPAYVPATLRIDVPVLLVDGRFDKPFCAQGGGGSLTDCAGDATLHASEAPFFSPAARLQTTVVPDSGHDLNLQRNAGLFFDRAQRWFADFFPRADPDKPVK
ncbi:MAG: alpha/beta hydrolase [Streptosporangiaceae bacterium]|nr:alpha/beta hydrolase [Streptosporangiaceae bacterium]